MVWSITKRRQLPDSSYGRSIGQSTNGRGENNTGRNMNPPWPRSCLALNPHPSPVLAKRSVGTQGGKRVVQSRVRAKCSFSSRSLRMQSHSGKRFSEMEPTNRKIQALVDMLLNRELLLPEMQRKYGWRSTQVRDLLDSIYR